jgi:CrcB protein
MLVFGVALAGAAGALSRFLLDEFVSLRVSSTRPLGTLVINVTGSLILGFLTGLVLYHGVSPNVRVVLGTGFCGAYTTFSTFAYETVRLDEEGARRDAAWNVAASFIVPALAAALGLALATL